MHDTGCLGLVHWDNPEGWNGEGGGTVHGDSPGKNTGVGYRGSILSEGIFAARFSKGPWIALHSCQKFWGVPEAGGTDPLPWNPPASLSRQPGATAVLWSWTLGGPELLLGASWGPGSPLHAVCAEPEIVSTVG